MPEQLASQKYKISGMDCAGCANTIENSIAKLTGVTTSELNFTTETLKIEGTISPEIITNRVQELGYGISDQSIQAATPTATKPTPTDFIGFMFSRTSTRLALLGLLLVLPGLIFHEFLPTLGIHHPLIDLTSILAMLVAGYPVIKSAWKTITISREININVLMTIASIGAIFIQAYTEAGVVMVLFALGEALESFTAERARDSIKSLMAVAPNTALLLSSHDEHTQEVVEISSLKIGDSILVKPGDRIPMDGIVQSGASSVNQAAITGESRLIEINPESEVFAGSINGEGSLEIKVTHLAKDNTVARLIRMVEEAQVKRAPAQRFVDQFAKVYTPIVVVIAALVALVPPLFFNQPFLVEADPLAGWLYRGLTLLVVACPCALVISTPVSIISAIGNGAKNGVIFKGGAFIESLSRVKAIAFDKTGTLTYGKPAVIKVQASDCENPNSDSCEYCGDLLSIAYAVEQRSEHPLALAITQEALHRGMQTQAPATNVKALIGQGVTGEVNGQQVMIGSHRYFDDHIVHRDYCEEINQAAENGFTPMLVSTENQFRGYILISDTVRANSKEVISDLHKLGVENAIMLTGDNQGTANSIAEQVGIIQVHAECLPEDKVRAVEFYKEQYGEIAMIGDGINDAPALAAASLGIAIGNTAQAMETADITLMSNNIAQLPFALKLSKATMRTIKANVIFSIGIKLIFLMMVLMGVGTMWMAVLADVGTSMLVTLNGTRLLKKPRYISNE